MRRQQADPTGVFGKLLTAIAGAALLVIGFMFSVVVLAVAVVVGLGIWSWFWWKTRKLRREIDEHLRDQAADAARPAEGEVIEGEAVVVEETTIRATSNRLPASPDRR
ncbi:MAG: hypothetical protein HXY29_07585 [Rhodocyclaceae bacterium]|jgi:hypothetical protein|nr:hypothetical protein [Rhodocyclaceae bacterium]